MPNSTDDHVPPLQSLMDKWLELRDAGREPTVEELTADPDKQAGLRDLIDRVRKVEALRAAVTKSDPDLGLNLPTVPGYSVLGELGAGGMAVVYRARHLGLNRDAAIKMLPHGYADQRQVLRFRCEAAAIAAVRHPHVLPVYDSGEVGRRPYLAMELCPGGSLKDRLQAGGKLAPAAAAELLAKVADGVGAAHTAGVFHRDLKPGNVLFDAAGEPRVADFGLAKRRTPTDQTADGSDPPADGLTRSDQFLGTPEYMSPEQARCDHARVGPATDVWALGVVLFECLTGQRPFRDADPLSLLRKVEANEPSSVRSIERGVPRDLELIVRKYLSKEPADRYPTANELRDDLRRFVRGEPVKARPLDIASRTVRWVRRNPLPTALLAAVLAAAGLVLLVIYQRALADKQRADLGKQSAEEILTRELENQVRRTREGHLARADLAGPRGQFREVVEALDAAGDLTIDHRLTRAKALHQSGQTDRFRTEMTALRGMDLAPAQQARWHLLRGEDLFGEDTPAAERNIRSALHSPGLLSGAEQAFAAGILAQTSSKAHESFQSAYDQDKTLLSAWLLDMFNLLMLGRIDEMLARGREASVLFPDEARVKVLMAIGFAFRGHQEGALALVPAIRAQKPEVATALEANIPYLALLHHETAFPSESERFDAAIRDLTFSGSTLKVLGQAVVTKELLASDATRLPLPPPARRVYQFWRKRLEGAAGGMNVGNFFVGLTPDEGKELSQLVDDHPEGLMTFLLAFQMFETANGMKVSETDPVAVQRRRDGFANAGRMYEKAIRAEGWVIDWKTTAFDMAVTAFVLAGQPAEAAGLPIDPTPIGKAMELLRERDGVRSWEQLRPNVPFAYLRAALYASELSIAIVLLERWKPNGPAEEAQKWFCRAKLDVELGAYHSALKAVEMARKLNVPDRRNEMTQVEMRCRAALRSAPPVREIAPAPDPRPAR